MKDARGGPIRYPSLGAAIDSIAPKIACGVDAMHGEHSLGEIDSDGDMVMDFPFQTTSG